MYRCGPAQGGVLPGSGASGGGETVIGTERFKSRIMQVNLQAVRRAFPYAVSCGRELYDLARSMEDELDRWRVDSFSQYSMRAVDAEMTRVLKETYHLGHMARMNPGSLPEFPITCQRGLFRLLEGGADEIGLELTDSCLMLPYKSVSGIAYETEATFENCMLCPRENCPTRRAPYDASMGAKTYHMSESDRLHSTDDLVGWLTTMPVMGEVVEKAVEAGVRDKVKIMIGGAPVTEAFGQSINADAYTPDATTCAEVAMQLLAS